MFQAHFNAAVLTEVFLLRAPAFPTRMLFALRAVLEGLVPIPDVTEEMDLVFARE